jgi:Tfp pilus assembly protein FimT
MRYRGRDARAGRAGFSLVELVVVVGIMMVLAAMTMPAIGRYFRLYKIRGAQQQVSGAIQTARNRAISKNVNLGVSFVVESPTRYWIHIEDDQSAAHSRAQQTLNFTAPNLAQSTSGTLPEGVRFAASASECLTPSLAAFNLSGSFSANAGFFRFNRLGAWCGVSCATLSTSATPPNAMMNGAAGSLVCLYQPATGLSRSLLVSPGGRVALQR